MYITDFEYDGVSLSEIGYMVCSFNSSSSNEVSNGSNIEFNTVPMNYGTHYLLANSSYPECITATFQICKNPCVPNYNPAMSVFEISKISSWLNRRDFHELYVDAEGYEDIYFEGSFSNIQRVEFGGITIGLTMEFKTNSPFAHKRHTEILEFENGRETKELAYYTDVMGDKYPTLVAISNLNPDAQENFDLRIQNRIFFGEDTLINNCAAGEFIALEYPMIETSSHYDGSSFNYKFIKLVRIDFADEYTINPIYCNQPCTMEIEYVEDIKISL